MAQGINLKKDISFKKKGKLPTKKTINLAGFSDQKKINWAVAIPLIIVILAAAAAIGKLGVYDRYQKLYALQNENAKISARIDAIKDEIEVYKVLTAEYAHYTFSNFTSEEMNRVDRVDVIKLLDKYVLPTANVGAWSLYHNTLTLTISDTTLAIANGIVAELEQDEMVNFCIVTTASTKVYDTDIVNATVTIYLNGPVDLES